MSSCPNGLGSCAGVGGGVAANTFAAALQFLIHSQCLISEPWPQQATVQNGSSVDVIIVGAGTAGSALAARLAETNLTVLLLEAGGDPPIESIVPGFYESLRHGQYCWNFTAEPNHLSSKEERNRRQLLSAGRVLGGTGSINYMIYSRSIPADYDEMADILGDVTWKWENVLPYFKKTERMTAKSIMSSSSAQYHGYDGDIQVSESAKHSHEHVTLLDAVAELGFKIVDDRNNPENVSPLRAYSQTYTIKNGKRQSSLTAMLNKVAAKSNLYVLKNALVSKILIENDTAYGVKVLIGDDEWEFHAHKEVIVSAGVYNTPKLLMMTGIGPHKHTFNMHNILPKKQLPVGENLQDHVRTVQFLAAESGLCSTYNYFDVIEYLYDRTGSLSIPSAIGLDYTLNSSAKPEVPDFGIFPTCIPKDSNFLQKCFELFDYSQEMCSYLHSLNKEHDLIPIVVILRKPKSRGLVTITSNDPLRHPIIYAGTFMEEEDLDGFPEVIQVARSFVNTTYFKSKNAFVVDFGLKSCEGLEWPEDLKCTVKNLAKFEGHAVGTAAMGQVLDSRMRVLGIDRLRVVDASAIPTCLRSGTNAAVIMLAEKAADFIKQDYGLIQHDSHNKQLDHSQHNHEQHDNDQHLHHEHNGQNDYHENKYHNEQHDYNEQQDNLEKHDDYEQHGHNGQEHQHGNHDHTKHDAEQHEHDEQHSQQNNHDPHDSQDYTLLTKDDLFFGKLEVI